MANNLIAKLFLDSKNFDGNLNKASSELKKFKSNCDSLGKGVNSFASGLGVNIGALTKFGGALGVAAAAGEAFKQVMQHNDALGDKWTQTMEVCTSVTDGFWASIGRGDLGSWLSNMDGIADAAEKYAKALDDAETFATANAHQIQIHSIRYQTALDNARNIALTETERNTYLREATNELNRQISLQKQLIGYEKNKAKYALDRDLAENGSRLSFSDSMIKAGMQYENGNPKAIRYADEWKKKADDLVNQQRKWLQTTNLTGKEYQKVNAEWSKQIGYARKQEHSWSALNETIQQGTDGLKAYNAAQVLVEQAAADEANSKKQLAKVNKLINGGGSSGGGSKSGRSTRTTKLKTPQQIANELKQLLEATARAYKSEILDNEALKGNDWKFTLEGTKAYNEYFDKLLKLYKKDSDDYKNALREKWKFEKEGRDHSLREAESNLQYAMKYNDLMKGEGFNYSDEGQKQVLNWLRTMQKYVEEDSNEYRDLSLRILEFKKNVKDALEDAVKLQRAFNKEIKEASSSYMITGLKPTAVTNKLANSVNAGFNAQVNSLAVLYNTELGKGLAADKKKLEDLKDAIDEVREAQDKWNDMNVASGTKLDIIADKASNVTGSIGAFANNMQSFQHLGKQFEEATTAVDKFALTMNLLNGVLEAYNETQAIINAVSDIFIAKKTEETAVTIASAVAKGSEAAVTTEQAAADAAGAVTSAAATTAKKAETTATIGSAIAKLFEATAAAGPWGIAIAAGSVAIMLAAFGAAIGMAQGFATGGVVGGTDYTGDKRTIRVNSGEMILNKRQLHNLFNMINTGILQSAGGQVEFKIKGRELVGVLNNFNNKTSKVL